MTSHLPVVVQQKTIVLQNLGGRLHPLASQVSATGKNTRGLGPESQGFSKFIFEISRFWFSRGWKVCTSSASRYDKQDKLISSLKSLTLRVILQKPKKFLEIITTLLIFLRHFFQLSCPEVRIFGVWVANQRRTFNNIHCFSILMIFNLSKPCWKPLYQLWHGFLVSEVSSENDCDEKAKQTRCTCGKNKKNKSVSEIFCISGKCLCHKVNHSCTHLCRFYNIIAKRHPLPMKLKW